MEDAEVKAIEDQFVLGEPKEMRCQGNNLIERICINPACKRDSLLCKDDKCEFCNENAHECAIKSLKGITELLEPKVVRVKRFMVEISKIEKEFICEVQKMREKFIKQSSFSSSFEDKYKKIIDEIYLKGNPKCLKGGEGKMFFDKITKKVKKVDEIDKNLLSSFQEKMTQFS